jgi:hypothetical protein
MRIDTSAGMLRRALRYLGVRSVQIARHNSHRAPIWCRADQRHVVQTTSLSLICARRWEMRGACAESHTSAFALICMASTCPDKAILTCLGAWSTGCRRNLHLERCLQKTGVLLLARLELTAIEGALYHTISITPLGYCVLSAVQFVFYFPLDEAAGHAVPMIRRVERRASVRPAT